MISNKLQLFISLAAFVALMGSGTSLFPQDRQASGAQRLTIKGLILNGTTNRAGRADELSLINLSQGMQTVETAKNLQATFKFKPVRRPKGPLLIRAVYKGQVYVKMVPPAPRFWKQNQKLVVYEPLKLPADTQITTAIHITRLKEGLKVSKIFAVKNTSKPPRTFTTEDFIVYVPSNAENVRASLEHESTRMPAPLKLQKKGDGFGIERGFRPGNSALSLEFTIKSQTFEDKLHKPVSPKHNFQLVFWKPVSAIPKITGALSSKKHDTKMGSMLKVDYPMGGTVTYAATSGDFLTETTPGPAANTERNAVFTDAWKTIAGIGGFLVIFFLIISLLRASGLKLVRK